MTELNLKTGQTYQVKLEGLGSAGYGWDYSIEQENEGTVEIELQQQVPPLMPGKNSMPQTFEAETTYGIKAIKPGSAEVRFFLHRAWEKDKPPLKEIKFSVEIQPG